MTLLYILVFIVGLLAVAVILAALCKDKTIDCWNEYDTTDYTDNEENERLK